MEPHYNKPGYNTNSDIYHFHDVASESFKHEKLSIAMDSDHSIVQELHCIIIQILVFSSHRVQLDFLVEQKR